MDPRSLAALVEDTFGVGRGSAWGFFTESMRCMVVDAAVLREVVVNADTEMTQDEMATYMMECRIACGLTTKDTWGTQA